MRRLPLVSCSAMDAQRHQRLGELYIAASELDGEACREYLERACGGDGALRAEVEALLGAGNGGRLDTPAMQVDLVGLAGDDRTPRQIGGYEVLRRIGEGGMGIVYEARQQSPDRNVAIKVMREPRDEDSLRRFEHEARVLGWLQHPTIAHVYEAGVARIEAGERPFFAMELVEGAAIDVHVRSAGLGVEEVLKLLVRVSEGVRHAHQKGVIHRDIKPGNILVRPDGQPKILDFGVARLAPSGGEEDSRLTRVGEVVGTLAYMSPEQVRADPRAIDARSDVYAMGVLSYELLAGERPLDVGGAPIQEAMRRVLEEEPRPLHLAMAGVPLDVSTIVHKALAKDPDRRYGSIEAFADDIGRYLRCEPILARPASAAYKVKRFVQRNRGATAGLAVGAAALLLGAVVSSWLFLREQSALESLRETFAALGRSEAALEDALGRSDARLAMLQRTNRHFEDLLAAPLPGQDGTEVKMVDVLRRAAAETTVEQEVDPEQRAWLASTLSTAFEGIRLHDDALEQAERAKAALAELDEPDVLTASMVCATRARALVEMRRHDEAKAEIEEGLALLAGVEDGVASIGRQDLFYCSALMEFDQGRFDEALVALEAGEQELDRADRVRPSDRAGLANLRVEILWSAGRLEEAEAIALATLEYLDEVGRSESFISFLLQNSLAAIYYNSGRAKEAIPLMRAALDGTRRQVGDEHEYVAKQLGNLATLMRQTGQMEEALGMYDEALEVSRKVFGPTHPSLAQTLSLRGSMLLGLERWDEGEASLLAAIAALEGQDGNDAAVQRAMAMAYLSPALRHRGEVGLAEERLREAIEIKRAVVGTEVHPLLLYDLQELSNCAKQRGAFDQMFDEGMRALTISLRFEGPGSPKSGGLINRLEDALRLMGEAGMDPASRAAKLAEALGR